MLFSSIFSHYSFGEHELFPKKPHPANYRLGYIRGVCPWGMQPCGAAFGQQPLGMRPLLGKD